MAINPSEIKGHGVYIIKSGEFYKIGKTSDLAKRVSSLQSANPSRLKVIQWLPCRNAIHASRLEYKLHEFFDGKCVNLEWFRLTCIDLQKIERFNRKGIPLSKNLYHPDWYYWNWFLAGEPWWVSKAKDKIYFNL